MTARDPSSPPTTPTTPTSPTSPTKPSAISGILGAIRDMLTSKKILAAILAAVVAGTGPALRALGISVDQTALDHVLWAILAYIGAQGIADVGKSAALLHVSAVREQDDRIDRRRLAIEHIALSAVDAFMESLRSRENARAARHTAEPVDPVDDPAVNLLRDFAGFLSAVEPPQIDRLLSGLSAEQRGQLLALIERIRAYAPSARSAPPTAGAAGATVEPS